MSPVLLLLSRSGDTSAQLTRFHSSTLQTASELRDVVVDNTSSSAAEKRHVSSTSSSSSSSSGRGGLLNTAAAAEEEQEEFESRMKAQTKQV